MNDRAQVSSRIRPLGDGQYLLSASARNRCTRPFHVHAAELLLPPKTGWTVLSHLSYEYLVGGLCPPDGRFHVAFVLSFTTPSAEPSAECAECDADGVAGGEAETPNAEVDSCLLYTSDAADE